MPFGCLSAVPAVITEAHNILSRSKTPRVLDCGVGSGIYGAMIRNWVDYGYEPNYRTYLMGIEGFPKYKGHNYNHYNYVHYMKIQDWLKWEVAKNDVFDVILLLDVLEHFDKQEGTWVLEELKKHLVPGGSLIVVTPSIHIEQGAIWGNVLETHKCVWTSEEMDNLGFIIQEDGKEPNDYGHCQVVGFYRNVPRSKPTRKKVDKTSKE